MGSCVARQPIFNSKLNIYGYELLYRSSSQSEAFSNTDGDLASSETIINSFHEMDIERVAGGKRAFVNFTEKLLLDGIATILPNRILVVEVLETISASDEVIKACQRLRQKGYLIALDDFVFAPESRPLINVADIIKIDFLASPLDEIKALCAEVKRKPIQLLAEKLETKEVFDTAADLGFVLFQGHFFSKPVIMEGTEVKLTPMKINCLELIRLSVQPNVDFFHLANIIKKDVALSYRLLRVVNSVFFGLQYTVKNIRQALAILGLHEIKKWITLISLAEIKDNKPDELIRISLSRARMLETLAPIAGFARSADDLFLLGLMSLMDAIMDLPMGEIIERTKVAPNIAQPLLTREGDFGRLLSMLVFYERTEWDSALAIAADYNISEGELFRHYLAAIEWAGNLS